MGRSKKTWDHLVDYNGNYGIDIKNGVWPGSGQAPSVKGEPGEKGKEGSGAPGATGVKGKKGDEGERGEKGDRGRRGLSLKGQKGDPGQGQKGEEGFAGRTGDKGETGEKGQKGDVQNLLHFQGQQPTVPDLPPPGNGQQPGDVWQITADDTFWVWDGSQWVKLSEALSVLKGEKGEEIQGPTGDKGEPALDGIDGTDGVDGSKGEKGEQGEEADKGEKGDEGEKGDKGDLGPSNYELYFDNTLDNPKLSEPEYLESLKGQKGDSGIDNSVLDNYYDQDEVNYLFEQYPNPPQAYDINYMDDNSVILPPGLVDFNSSDHNDRIYNKGMVTILPGCTIVNSPAPNTPLLLLNWVMADASGLRDVDYTLIQFLFNADDASVTEGGYYRRCTPGLGRFSPWSSVGTGGSLDDYYTKLESDDRYVLAPHVDPNFALFTEAGENFLKLFTAGATAGQINELGNVKLLEGPGIKLENVNGELKLSTTSEPLYLGTLEFDQDPQVEFDTRPEHDQKTLQNGNFYIYTSEGLAVGVEPPDSPAQSSDFCVYDKAADEWKVVKRETSGIQTLTTEPHGRLGDFDTLLIDNSDPKALSIRTTDQVVVQRQLFSHPRWSVLADLEARRRIEQLSNVDVPNVVVNPGSHTTAGYGNYLDFGGIPQNPGEISIDVDSRSLKIHYKGNSGTDNTWIADALGNHNPGERLQISFGDVLTTATVINAFKPGAYFEFILGDDSAAMMVRLASTTLLNLLGQTSSVLVAGFDIVTTTAETGSLLLYNSATENWEASGADAIGNFIKKDGDEIPAGAEHCWMGGDYPLLPSKMCLGYAKLNLTDSYALTDRASMNIIVPGGSNARPVALSSTNSYGTLFAVYSQDTGQPNNKGLRFSLDGNGSIKSNGSLFLDVSSQVNWPDNEYRALRVDVDGDTRLLYNSQTKELSLSESLLRVNFTANQTSNLAEIKIGNDLITTYAKDGVLTHTKRIDIDTGSLTGAALRLVGNLAVKSSTNIDANDNSLSVGDNFFQVTAKSTFNRTSYGDDSVTFEMLGKKPGSSRTNDQILTFYQDSVQSNGDSINYYGRMDQDANILNKKYIDDNYLPYDISSLPLLP